MKTEKIQVNKTAENPDGVEIEIIQPETDLQGRLIAFLMPSYLRELKAHGRISYDLPDKLQVEHKSDGTFIVSGAEGEAGMYEVPRPTAIVGIRIQGRSFDVVHAEITPQLLQQAVQAPAQDAQAQPDAAEASAKS